MEEDLIAIVHADASVQALFKVTGGDTRVFLGRALQNVAKPYATLTRVSNVVDNPHDGPSGLEFSRVQIDVYGETYVSTITAARAIARLLTGLKRTQGTTRFQGIFRADWRETIEHDDTTDKLFRQSLDFEIWHRGA